MNFDEPIRLRAEDAPAPDPQAVMIELAEMAQRLGTEAVHLLHLYDHGRDLIEVHRRARLHAEEVHREAGGVLAKVELLSKALRSGGAFSTTGGRDGR